MAEMDEKPAELIKLALSRALFCQLCALEDELADYAIYFTIGLLIFFDVRKDTELSVALGTAVEPDGLTDVCVGLLNALIDQAPNRAATRTLILSPYMHLMIGLRFVQLLL